MNNEKKLNLENNEKVALNDDELENISGGVRDPFICPQNHAPHGFNTNDNSILENSPNGFTWK